MAIENSPGPNLRQTNTTRTVSTTLTWDQQQTIRSQITADILQFNFSPFRLRYTLLDLAYYMETSERFRDSRTPKLITNLYKDLELPVLMPNIDAAYGYYIKTFLSAIPLFGVVNDNESEDKELVKKNKNAAKQMETIIYENSRMTGWARQIALTIKSGLKYNVAGCEIEWKAHRVFKPITDTTQSFTTGSTEPILRAGNELKNLNMYNTFFDHTVSPGNIHTDGDFSGTIEKLSLIRLHRLIADLRLNGGYVMNINDTLWKSAPYRNHYHIPIILNEETVQSGTNWFDFFNNRTTPLQFSGGYEVITYNRRIIPSMMGIKGGVPDPDSPQIWKFIEVNGYIIYAERRTNAHDWLPHVYMQPIEDNLGYQTKGMGQILLSYQTTSNTMFRARIANLARGLSDRALYDPSRISEKLVNSAIPSAKIPVRPSAYNKNVSDAYYAIPFDDRQGQSLYGDIAKVMEWAGDSIKLNRPQKGQLTKGNRTATEFNKIMQNSDDPQLANALLMENQFFIPIKHQIKVNTLQYQTNDILPIINTQDTIKIDPVVLRQAVIDFKLSSSLIPKESLLGTEQNLRTFQVLSAIPGANQEWDLVGMFVESMEQKGAKLAHHRRAQLQNFEAPKEQEQQQIPVPQQQIAN